MLHFETRVSLTDCGEAAFLFSWGGRKFFGWKDFDENLMTDLLRDCDIQRHNVGVHRVATVDYDFKKRAGRDSGATHCYVAIIGEMRCQQ